VGQGLGQRMSELVFLMVHQRAQGRTVVASRYYSEARRHAYSSESVSRPSLKTLCPNRPSNW
jgi:hypothetical protein